LNRLRKNAPSWSRQPTPNGLLETRVASAALEDVKSKISLRNLQGHATERCFSAAS
jgi:hypothetical protein